MKLDVYRIELSLKILNINYSGQTSGIIKLTIGANERFRGIPNFKKSINL